MNDKTKKFGIELEFPKYVSSCFDKDEWESIVDNASKNLGLKFKVSPFEGSYSWTVKEDLSAGIEITSPALFCNQVSFQLLDEFLSNLERSVLQDKSLSLDDFESEENGYHIHLSLSNFSDSEHYNSFFRFFLVFEKTIFSFFPTSRRNNHFTESLKSILSVDYPKTHKKLMSFDFSKDPRFTYHHCCLNENGEYRTLELRHSNGTLDRKHLLGWLSFILLAIDVSSDFTIPSNFSCIDNLKTMEKSFLRHSFYNWKTDLLPIVFSWMKVQESKQQNHVV